MGEPEEPNDYPDGIDRKSGILTPSQRRFLLDGDRTGNQARQVRYRIRQRFKEALRDMSYLSHMRREDVHTVFEDFKQGETEYSDEPSLSRVSDLFYLLYTGLGQGHFQTTMEAGIKGSVSRREVEERDCYPPRVDITFHVDVDPEELIPIEETLQKLQAAGGEIPSWATVEHYNALASAGRLDELPEQQIRLFEFKIDSRMEHAAREYREEFIRTADPGYLSIAESLLDESEYGDLIEERKREIVEETLEDPSEWGLTVELIGLLEDHGVFNEDTAADYRDRYRYVGHLHQCSGLVEFENEQEQDATIVTPDMFDTEMEHAHQQRARELLERYLKGEELTSGQYDCILIEREIVDQADHVDRDALREAAVDARERDRDEWSEPLPPEYRG